MTCKTDLKCLSVECTLNISRLVDLTMHLQKVVLSVPCSWCPTDLFFKREYFMRNNN